MPIPLNDTSPPEAALDLAAETLYRFLAAALSDPRGERWQLIRDPACQKLAVQAAELLRGEFAELRIPLGFGEAPAEDLDLGPAAAILRERPQDAANDFLRVFGLVHSRECPPYETEYHPNGDPFFRAQQLADVAGFYRAFGLVPEPRDRADHVALELEFSALLLFKQRQAAAEGGQERVAVCRQARRTFFADHLSWWLPSFALGLRTKAEIGFYESIGRALAALLPIERRRLGVAAPRVPVQAHVSEPAAECAGCLAVSGA